MDLNIHDHIRPVSDFRKDTATILKQLKADRHPIVLTQRGRGIAVIIDVDTYERLEYENQFRASVRRGLDDLKHGRTIPHEQVMKDMRVHLRKLKSK